MLVDTKCVVPVRGISFGTMTFGIVVYEASQCAESETSIQMHVTGFSGGAHPSLDCCAHSEGLFLSAVSCVTVAADTERRVSRRKKRKRRKLRRQHLEAKVIGCVSVCMRMIKGCMYCRLLVVCSSHHIHSYTSTATAAQCISSCDTLCRVQVGSDQWGKSCNQKEGGTSSRTTGNTHHIHPSTLSDGHYEDKVGEMDATWTLATCVDSHSDQVLVQRVQRW